MQAETETHEPVSDARIRELLYVNLPSVKVHPEQLMVAWCEILRDTQNALRDLLIVREAFAEAIEDIEDWAGYASDYFRDKHDLAGTLAKHRALLAKVKP